MTEVIANEQSANGAVESTHTPEAVMAWALVAIACIFLAIRFRFFRFTLFVVVGLVVLTVAVYMAHESAETESSKHLVRADQLAFTDLRLGPDRYGSSYRLTGRVKNNSPYSVFEVKATICILDCDAQSHCDVVGEEEAWNMSPLVPPGQVRDIDTSVYFGSGTQIKGQFQSNYEITEIRARS
jgi:hypothetical protein